ncbi:cytochrome P450 [Actinocorallia populi]|uniref:cytochrome P450 n=1 Tax=Actinocorallia populi TaxID=2079200 RepID=UPI000D0938F3|nr:cytochrome P450 [Actinocorallia populi]
MSSDLEYSPYDYRVHEDPYPVYARLRREAPLYRNEELDFWALSRHADVATAFRDWERFSSVNGVTLDASAWGPHAHRTMSFLALDPPRHTRLRSLVSRGFTPRRVRELHPRILEMTRTLLEPLIEGEPFDFVADFAGVLPMDVISELMGVPEADRPELRRLAEVVVHREEGVQDVPPAGMDAALTLVGYYAELLAAKRRKPGDDLTSALLEAEVDGDRLADGEIIAFLFLMVIAGNETTTKLLANALYWAWKHRLTDRVLKEPVDAWIEETLRYDTSSQQIARTVAEDFTAHGRTVPAGSRLLLLVGSANRDEDVFPGADRYDLDRDTSQLISFGGGRHYCLGANMARLEAQIALTEFTRLVSAYEVDEANAVRVHSSNVRGFASLPVSLIGRSPG